MIGKIAFGLVIIAAIALLTPFAQATSGVYITDIDVYYDGETYEGCVCLLNIADENVTVNIEVKVDGIEIYDTELNLSIEYFKGFRIKTHEYIYFEVPGEEGIHDFEAFNTVGKYTTTATLNYEAYGYIDEEKEEEEEEVEEVEDWLECP